MDFYNNNNHMQMAILMQKNDESYVTPNVKCIYLTFMIYLSR